MAGDHAVYESQASEEFSMDEKGTSPPTSPKKFRKTRKRRIIIISTIIALLVIGGIIALVVVLTNREHAALNVTVPPSATTDPPPSSAAVRIDCFPEGAVSPLEPVSKDACQARGCEFDSSPTNNEPSCYYPQDATYGYRIASREIKANKERLNLEWMGADDLFPFADGIRRISLDFQSLSDHVLRIKISDPANARYEVPVQINLPNGSSKKRLYDVVFTGGSEQDAFSFKVIRSSTNTIIWDTAVGGFIFSDQFIQIATRLPSKNVYGFGENNHLAFKHSFDGRPWPIFAQDLPPKKKNYSNLYGHHPFYECVENDGNTHGVLIFNSNAQEYQLSPEQVLTYRTTGGVLDIYMFLGPEPEMVTQQYTELIGRPVMVPYWALGFQLCRYGYNSLDRVKEAVERTKEANIPHDIQYVDIDHMDERKDFTVDNENFAGLADYFRELQAGGMRTIIILDPALSISPDSRYEPYERMDEVDGNIKWPVGFVPPPNSTDRSGAVLGAVWPLNKVVFPDFFKKRVRDVWRKLIVEHHSSLPFDGLWIDMNEPANFETNEEKPFNWPASRAPWSLKCGNNTLDDPSYRPLAAYLFDDAESGTKGKISRKTLCMNTVQGERNELNHYDVHSLYGWSQTEPTLRGVQEATGKRSIVISRSTFPGSGKYAGHWLGDNDSQWPDMERSIIGILEFNLFGIPYIGADICGFVFDTTAELCKRWMQLGAFYTFSRNHNGIEYIDQDPGVFGADVVTAAREAMETRYQLLPYLYTLFHKAHVYGNTVIRPLHHEFPNEERARDTYKQFLWGPALMIAPILEPNAVAVSIYFPNATWYHYYNGVEIPVRQMADSVIIYGVGDKIPLFIRGGYILPQQEPANNTFYSRQNPFSLLVALDSEGKAMGDLFWDDGDSIDTYEKGNYFFAEFVAQENSLSLSVRHNVDGTEFEALVLDNIVIYGVEESITFVYINDETTPVLSATYNASEKTLRIEALKLPLHQDVTISWPVRRRLTETETSRLDCLPDVIDLQVRLSTQSNHTCSKRGCLWSPVAGFDEIPPCYIDSDNYGYEYVSEEAVERGTRYNLRKLHNNSLFGGDFDNIYMDILFYSNDVFRIQINTGDDVRYTVPIKLNTPDYEVTERRYNVEVSKAAGQPFSLKVMRRSTGEVIWDTGVGGLTFADQFLQLSTRLPSKYVYGFGENRHLTFRHDLEFARWPLFARDQPPGWPPQRSNLYGVHPFYHCVENDGNTHGVMLMNSNAQDYSFSPLPMLTYRTIGGIFDFYFFLGPHPENVVQQYTELVGRPFMPPYWSLGFQLCRYGYMNIENLKTAVDRTRNAGIPYDVQYADIDYMIDQIIFTVDDLRFPGLADYFRQLQAQGMKIITMLDPFMIANRTNYDPYEKMKRVGGNVRWPDNFTIPDKSSDDTGALLGYVWPKGKTVFPDFFLESAQKVWIELVVDHVKNVLPNDGLWIDMNEPANFGTNEERPWNWPVDERPYWSLKCVGNRWDEPPYKTLATYAYDTPERNATLPDKTICMNVVQGPNGMYRHYDVHNLYGWSHTVPSLLAMQNVTGHRSVIITRSTFATTGSMAGHWLGDNNSEWPHLAESIIGMMEFNLFGIPYVGADICGFFGNATDEMCKRWMQLGAFYPFSRNHNGIDFVPQDPGVFSDESVSVMRQAMITRYWLLPYLYTLFYNAHVYGSTVVRPVHHEFYWDKRSLSIDKQFLWGHALLISPILEESQTSLTLYLPSEARWYDYFTGELTSSNGGLEVTLPVESDTQIPLHLRGGTVLPIQAPANNTEFSRPNNMTLRIALDNLDTEQGRAEGELFWDDGDSKDTYENGNYSLVKFYIRNNKLEILPQHTTYTSLPILSNIEIYGVNTDVKFISIDTETYDTGNNVENFDYNSGLKVLKLADLNMKLNQKTYIAWWSERLPTVTESGRVDCLPDGQTVLDNGEDLETQCTRRSCIWSLAQGNSKVPACYIDNTRHGYTLHNGSIRHVSEDTELVLNKLNGGSSMFGGDVHNITLQIRHLANDMLQLKFVDPNDASRYEVPIPINDQSKLSVTAERLYNVEVGNTASGMFYLRVTRNGTGDVIWDTSVGGLTFADQFLQLATKIPEQIYGFGENIHPHFMHHDKSFIDWPMFSRDQPPWSTDIANLYGVHPFYLAHEPSGSSHGVFLRNSNAQEVTFSPLPMLTYRTIGGILDFYMFFGPTPENVVQKYTEVIGRPYLPPYWSLGFQMSRYGYNHLDNMKAAYQRTVDADIPLDVQYGDIDYMDERKILTYDRINFEGLSDFVRSIKFDGKRYIVIIDPFLLSNDTNYAPYQLGLNASAYIKWPAGTSPDISEYDNDNMLGFVWPKGKVVFPDFFKNSTTDFWKTAVAGHQKDIEFDGLWLDMNEPANFGTNDERPFNWPIKDRPYWSLKCPESRWDDPPYKPRSIKGSRLSDKTLCMVAEHNDGALRHYDVHNLYGISGSKPTLDALRASTGNNRRGTVITRSTFPGSGAYVGHWLGDNHSAWSHLRDSIIGIMEFNLFGIPFIGADICGFFGDADAELCQRWMQLGAFYTFSRNHNGLNTRDQDPGNFGAEVADSSRQALRLRYSLLPYLYTLFYQAHADGSTVIRPLGHEFFDDYSRDVDSQFLWGAGLMIAPIMYKGKTSRDVYFPDDRWFDFQSGVEVMRTGEIQRVAVPRDAIPVYIRGGFIIPTQEPANSTFYSRKNSMSLNIAPDRNGTAEGSLFWDDGDSIDTAEDLTKFYLGHFAYEPDKVNLYNVSGEHDVQTLSFSSVRIFGVVKKPTQVLINTNPSKAKIHYYATPQMLVIDNLNFALRTPFVLSWT